MAEIKVTLKDIEKAIVDGLPLTCATCVFFYTAKANNSPTCGQDCGGPFLKKSFPCYQGQIPRDKFDKMCLMCGDSRLDCHVLGDQQKFGLCLKHKDTFSGTTTTPEGKIVENPIIIPNFTKL